MSTLVFKDLNVTPQTTVPWVDPDKVQTPKTWVNPDQIPSQSQTTPWVDPDKIPVSGSPSQTKNAVLPADTKKQAGRSEYEQLIGIDTSLIGTNVLNQYDTYTYHWRLYLMDDTYSRRASERPSELAQIRSQAEKESKVITVLESGIPGYTINEVHMVSKVSDRNSITTSIKMMMTEPFGISFYEKLALAATKMRVPSWISMQAFLELSFTARGSSGEPVRLPIVKTWPIVFTDIKARVKDGATEYEMTMVPQPDVARATDVSRLRKPISITAATIGDFFDQLKERLRPDPAESTDFFVLDHRFNFVFHGQQHDDVRNWALFDNGSALIKPQNSASWSKVKFNGTQVTFAEGSSVYDIVDVIFACTKEAQQKLGIKNKETPDVASQSQNGNVDKAADATVSDHNQTVYQMPVVIPQVVFREYDEYVNDYHKDFTFHLHFRDISNVYLDPQQQNTSDPKEAERRFYQFGRRLARRYDYVYTGLNTDVLNLDINLDHLFKNSYALMGGTYSSALVNDGYLLDANKAKVRIGALMRRYDTAVRDLSRIQSELNAIKDSKDNVSIKKREELLSRQQKLQSQTTLLKSAGNAIRANADIPPTEIEKEVSVNELTADQKSAIERQNKRIDQFNKDNAKVMYAENLRGDLQIAMDWFASQSKAKAGDDSRSAEANYLTSVETQYDRGRHLAGAVLNQIYATRAGDFVNVRLDIRGDPYWLGMDPFEIGAYQNKLIDKGYRDKTLDGKPSKDTEAHTVNGYPNFIEAQHMFLLTFNLPTDYDDNGNAKPAQSSMFENVYQVIDVASIFRNGMFTQTLTAIMDHYKNDLLIRRMKERDALVGKPVTTPTNSGVPPVPSEGKSTGNVSVSSGNVSVTSSTTQPNLSGDLSQNGQPMSMIEKSKAVQQAQAEFETQKSTMDRAYASYQQSDPANKDAAYSSWQSEVAKYQEMRSRHTQLVNSL